MKSHFSSLLFASISSSACSFIGAIAIGLIPTLPANSQTSDMLPTSPPANILKSLNLSDPQRQQIQAILQKDQKSRRSSFQELRAKEQELRTMMDGNVPRGTLIQKFNQIQTLRRQNEQRRFEQMLSIREVLTPQQRSQLSKAAKEANGNRRERRQRKFISPENLDLPK